jgi:hypothetical protein
MKLQELNKRSYFVVLPKAIVLAKGWKKGDDILYKINDKGELVLFK